VAGLRRRVAAAMAIAVAVVVVVVVVIAVVVALLGRLRALERRRRLIGRGGRSACDAAHQRDRARRCDNQQKSPHDCSLSYFPSSVPPHGAASYPSQTRILHLCSGGGQSRMCETAVTTALSSV
jgi:hypothetical protein